MSKSLKANTSGKTEYKKKNHYKLKDGDLVYRIVPPMTKFTDDPRGWSKFHSVHFGYKNTEGKMRTFESPLVKNNKTKTVEVADAALDRLNDLKNKLEEAKKAGNGPLVAKLNTLVGFKGVYNIDNNHHMNVIGLDGSIGELKIRHKAKLALDAVIKRLEAEGVSPLSEEDGRFFVFHRDGMNVDTNFKVSVYQERVMGTNGKPAYQDVSHTITPELWLRLENEAFDLKNEISAKLTPEEVAAVVAESDLLSGKSAAVDRFFDQRWKARWAEEAQGAQDDNSNPYEDGPDESTTQAVAGTTTSTAQAAIVATSTLPAGSVQSVAVVTTPVVSQAVAAKTQSQAVDEMSDADFFKMIGQPA